MDSLMLRDLRDDELVELVRGGQETAFEELLSRYETRVYRLSLILTRNSSIAEEVLARVFCELFLQVQDPGSILDVEELVFGQTIKHASDLKKHICVHEVESTNLGTTSSQTEFEFADDDDDTASWPLHKWGSSKLRNHLNYTLESVPEDYKQIFVLHDVVGISSTRMGQLLSRAIPEVKLLIVSARIAMRAFLKSPQSLPMIASNSRPNLRGTRHCDA